MKPDHAHEYELPMPNGPTAVGICRVCGHQKTHRNSLKVDKGLDWTLRFNSEARKMHKANTGP